MYEICPDNCPENGVCKEIIGCICKTGFISNDSSIKIKCKNKCSNNGVCHNNGKFGCFPGWRGVTCENKINYSKNCTSLDNGICQMNRKCLCREGFEGEDCSSFKQWNGIKKRLSNLYAVNKNSWWNQRWIGWGKIV